MSIFLNISEERVLFRGEYFFMIYDAFPVSPQHILIISNSLKEDYFSLSIEEQLALPEMVRKAKSIIENEVVPDGYNIGMNCGSSGGQTVMHFHCHVIPRFLGDMENPRGGIRHCVQGKGDY